MSENSQKQVAEVLLGALSPQPETAAEETPEPTEEAETQASSSETLETQDQDESPAVEPSPETDEEGISTLNHLAETLDIPIEDMYALNFRLGNDSEISLGELKDFFEQNSDIQEARANIENERSLLKAESEKLNQTPQVPPELIQAQAAMMQIEQGYQALEQSGLKDSDPGKYAAQKLELQNQYQQAAYTAQNAGQIVEQRRQALMQTETQKLHEAIPKLKDKEFREATAKRVEGFIKGYGFSVDDLGDVLDHRLMRMIIDASAAAELTSNARSKRVDTAPKVLKPQAVANSQAGRKASLKRLTERARSSNRPGDKAAAIAELIR